MCLLDLSRGQQSRVTVLTEYTAALLSGIAAPDRAFMLWDFSCWERQDQPYVDLALQERVV